MISAERACPACHASVPENAGFCPTCGARVAGSGALPPEANAADGDQAAFLERLQTALGPSLQLRGTLGRGGFAEVFVAWDTRLKRELAIKTIRQDLGTASGLRERFQREAEAVAMLRHPHIIPIYTVGEENGVAYFSMPRIVGETLAAVLQRDGRMDPRLACRIIAEAAGALETAHRAGVIHRDIKPENIMLEGPEQRAIVMDFGIAKTGPSTERGLTGTGMFVGTPDYMSPEQAAGDRELDHRPDQYSLALVAFRMMAGERVFESDSLHSALYKQATTIPPLLSDVNPDVPAEVADAIRRALGPDAATRFPSIGEFGAALGNAFGATTGGGRVITRREPDAASRLRAMHAAVPHWRDPLTIAGVLGLAAFVELQPLVEPREPYQLAAERGDAEFAARSWMAANAVAQPRLLYSTMHSNKQTYAFLQRALGLGAAEQAARRDGFVWHWSSFFRDSANALREVEVAQRGRIVGYSRALPDTLARQSVGVAAATQLAQQALVKFGIAPESLLFVGDSALTRVGRTDHFLTWRWRDEGIRGLARDTATRRVSVAVQGDRVERVNTFLHVPRSSMALVTASEWLRTASGFTPFSIVLLIIVAIAAVVQRQRIDTLQWKGGARLLFIAAALSAPYFFVNAWHDVVTAELARSAILSSAAQLTLLVVGLGGAALCMFVAAESLAAEHRPQLFDGVRELTRRRVLVPELAAGAFRGVAWGCVALGSWALATWVRVALLGGWLSAAESGEIVNFGWMGAGLSMSFAIPIVCALLFMRLIGAQWRWSPAVATAVVAVVGTMIADTGPTHWGMFFSTGIAVLVLALAAWHSGLLAGAIATALVLPGPELAGLLRSAGAGGPARVLTTSVALVFLPVILGILAYRRARRVVAVTVTPASR